MFTFMAGISEFERALMSQRTKEGLESARSRGIKGERKPKFDINKKKAIYELYNQKQMTIKDICNMFDISNPTLYKVIEEISHLNKFD